MPARKERGMGIPLNDAQRVARHYSITIEEAYKLLSVYSVNELLPERGYGLTLSSDLSGYSIDDLGFALNAMESYLPHGGRAMLSLYTQSIPTEEDIAETYLGLIEAGFHVSYPKARLLRGVPTTEMVLTKGSPQWSLLIPILPTLFVVGLIGFGLARIESISRALLPITITLVVGVIAVAGLMRRPVERITEKVGQRYLPQTVRRYGLPHSEEERAKRHEELYPGETLPERGTGISKKKALAVR
jgi:hypothetical protein